MANNYFDFINQNSRTADDLTPASGAQVQLTLRVDADSFLFIDGEYTHDLEAGKPLKISLAVGEYIFEFAASENPEVKIEKIVNLDTAGKKYLVVVNDLKKELEKKAFVPHLQVQTTTVSLNSEESSQSIRIEANCDWIVLCKQSWISLSPIKGGENNSSLEIRAEVNTQPEIRKATIKVANEEFGISQTINVTQAALNVKADPSRIITYTTIDGKIIDLSESWFDARMISNNYINGEGVLIFDSPVRRIKDKAFFCEDNLLSICLPSSVIEIDEGAFIGCTRLQIIDLPNGLSKIGDYAFVKCDNLRSITLPESVLEVGEGAFSDCFNLTSVILLGANTQLGKYAFSKIIALDAKAKIIRAVNMRADDARLYWEPLSLPNGSRLVFSDTTINIKY